ncbi:conserved hypothetical protein [Pseudomonas sp. OF001]|uniref:hypothetical protein n=1 Tax=Pseudomonas sp. OF001 TaxID=2772300 RepID=UPI001917BAA2|nr:hypothetical protein [Pseudomonas sp. OF001]CAD5379504.1 conserved hypothetical protein [Pseudomonas sp. OF001]
MHLQIDDFYQDASRALLALYRAFPRKTTLYIDDLIGYHEPDEYGLPAVRHQSCLGTLLWLGEEGYLRHEGTIRHEALEQAVLSEKGFLRLSGRIADAALTDSHLPPSVLRVHATLAWQLQESLASGDSERLIQLARRLFAPSQSGAGDTV